MPQNRQTMGRASLPGETPQTEDRSPAKALPRAHEEYDVKQHMQHGGGAGDKMNSAGGDSTSGSGLERPGDSKSVDNGNAQGTSLARGESGDGHSHDGRDHEHAFPGDKHHDQHLGATGKSHLGHAVEALAEHPDHGMLSPTHRGRDNAR